MTKVITRVHPVYLINVHCVPKTSTFLFFQQLCQTLIECNILGTLNPEKIDREVHKNSSHVAHVVRPTTDIDIDIE